MPSQTPSAVLVKTSLVDFPERVAAACFLSGCNLRCPYCYNAELVFAKKAPGENSTKTNDEPRFVGLEQIVAHLKKRANVLTGFVISGGEPLCNPEAVHFLIKEARSLGYKIKLDTNGLFPDRLKALLDDGALCPDYVALDVKTCPARYSELQNQKPAQADAAKKIVQSIKIVSSLAPSGREFRTVLYPPLVARSDIEQIAALLPKDARWYFARFINSHCLSSDAEKVLPYGDSEESELLETAQKTIVGAAIR